MNGWRSASCGVLLSLVTTGVGAQAADTPTPQLVVQNVGRPVAATHVAVSRNGSIVASASGSDIHVWEASTGARLCSLDGKGPLALSADGTRLVSAGPRRTIVVWDLRRCGTKEEIAVPGRQDVRGLEALADGRVLVSGGFAPFIGALFDPSPALTVAGVPNVQTGIVGVSANGSHVLEMGLAGAVAASAPSNPARVLRVLDVKTGRREQLPEAEGPVAQGQAGVRAGDVRLGAVSPSGRWVFLQLNVSAPATRQLTAGPLAVFDRSSGRVSAVATLEPQMPKSTPEAPILATQAAPQLRAMRWLGFSDDEQHVYVIRRIMENALGRTRDELAVLRRTDLQVERSISLGNGSADNEASMSVIAAALGGDGHSLAWVTSVGEMGVVDPARPDAVNRSWRPIAGRLVSVRWTPEGDLLAVMSGTGESQNANRLLRWSLSSGSMTLMPLMRWSMTSQLSSDGGRLLESFVAESGPAIQWLDTATGATLWRRTSAEFTGCPIFQPERFIPRATAISDDGSQIATLWQTTDTPMDGTRRAGMGLCVLDASNGRVLAARPVTGGTLAYLPGGRTITVGLAAFELVNGALAEKEAISAPAEDRRARQLSPDGKLAALATRNGAIVIQRADGTKVCTLYSFADAAWAVVDPQGRFDTNRLEDDPHVHWVMPDEPLRSYSIELFMRVYYEPRLLARLVGGEVMKPVPRLETINRAQPAVRIVGAKVEAGGDRSTATVVVEVRTGSDSRRGAPGGVRDVHLFRNGQLAALGPDDGGAVRLDPRTGIALISFEGVRLPSTQEPIEFSAYAFNDDRVKSSTVRQRLARESAPAPRRPAAYVVSIGVNDHEAAEWNLKFAADDARAMMTALAERLRATNAFSDVVAVPLVSDGANRAARKDTIRKVLALLSRRAPGSSGVAEVPESSRLRPATPDDLVIVTFSGHGYNGRNDFFLLPSDTGASTGRSITPGIEQRSISSDELAAWLRDIDAGELALVIDACHSAASVESPDFKAGPMGARGLGQMAYNKGMRILAATQADNVAIESGALRHGVLTYALVDDGLLAARADYKPRDRRIDLVEWLSYGVDRVPTLYAQSRPSSPGAPSARARSPTTFGPDGTQQTSASLAVQTPTIFDFSSQRRSSVIAEVH